MCDICRPEGEMYQFALGIVKEGLQELGSPGIVLKASIRHTVS